MRNTANRRTRSAARQITRALSAQPIDTLLPHRREGDAKSRAYALQRRGATPAHRSAPEAERYDGIEELGFHYSLGRHSKSVEARKVRNTPVASAEYRLRESEHLAAMRALVALEKAKRDGTLA